MILSLCDPNFQELRHTIEHGVKVVDRVLERTISNIMTVTEMQLGFIPDKNQVMLYLS